MEGIDDLNPPEVLEAFRGKKGKGRRGNTSTLDGIKFDSDTERRYYITVLKPLLQAGVITEFEAHPRFLLLPKGYDVIGGMVRAVHYTPDFKFVEDNHLVVVDVKPKRGVKLSQDFSVRRALFIHRYPEYEFRVAYANEF